MAHKSEFVSTVGGFSVLNGSTKTPVINQDGTLNGSAVIDDASITTAKLASNAVETAKIKDANVTTAKLADASVTTAKLEDASVTTAKLEDDLVYIPSMVMNNSVQYSVNDPLSVTNVSGVQVVKLAVAGERIIGYAAENKTAAADNVTVAKETIKIFNRDKLQTYTSAAAIADSALHTYYAQINDATSATGAIVLANAGPTPNQFYIVGTNGVDEVTVKANDYVYPLQLAA